MSGPLLVLRDRLTLLENIAMGVTNPATILSDINRADDSEEGPCIITEWSEREIAERRAADRQAERNREEWERRDRRVRSFVLHKGGKGNI